MTNINIRIDRELKRQAEEFFDEVGLTMTTAFNLFVKQTLRRGKIPFEISADPFYGDSNMRVVDEGIDQIRKGKVVHKTLDDLEEMTHG
jgi:DNA-damage-inducible protein J